MKTSTKFLIAFLVTFMFSSSVHAMTIESATADELAQTIMGTGITIQNVQFTGTLSAAGKFSGGIDAGIGIESGIVLTTGSAESLNTNSNNSDGTTTNNGLPGTSYLNALIPGYNTYDATVLEFDFQATEESAYFAYVFGSEEYNEWVNSSYNDVFGFFLDGTDVGDNVAILPDGTTVSINNINNSSHSEYYNDNDPSDNSPPPYAFEYDGFTDVLTVTLTGLEVGSWHHLTLAIADAGDRKLDSGVFIGAGTFSVDPPTAVPEPASILLMGSALAGLAGFRKIRG